MARTRLFQAVILTMIMLAGCYKPMVQSVHRDVNASVMEPDTIGYYLPKGMIRILFFLNPTPTENEATLEIKPLIVPDPNYFFTMSYKPSAFSDDIVGFDFEKADPQKSESDKQPLSDTFTDGQRQVFLKKLSTTATDRWVDIADKLTQLAKQIALANLPAPPSPRGLVKLAAPQIKYDKFVDVVIDPDDPKDLQPVNDILKKYGIVVTLGGLGFNQPATATSGPLEMGQNKGIYTRMVLPYRVSVKSGLTTTGGNGSIQGAIRTMVFNLPNGSPIVAPEVTRALFVRKDTILNFAQGRLADYQISKPSEALGFVMIPYNVAQEIISIPTQIFQFKIDLIGRQTKVYKESTGKIGQSQPQGGGAQ